MVYKYRMFENRTLDDDMFRFILDHVSIEIS